MVRASWMVFHQVIIFSLVLNSCSWNSIWMRGPANSPDANCQVTVRQFLVGPEKIIWDHSVFAGHLERYYLNPLPRQQWDDLIGRSPEEILAIIESDAKAKGLIGITDQEFFKTASKGKIKALVGLLENIQVAQKLSPFQIRQIVTELYSLNHGKDYGLIVTLFKLRSHGHSRLVDNKIIARVESELLRRNMLDAFEVSGLLGKNTKLEGLREFFSKKKNYIQSALSAILTLPAMTQAKFFPLYLPHVKVMNLKKLNGEILEVIEREGIEAALPLLRKMYKKGAVFEVYWTALAKTYNSLAWAVLLGYVALKIHENAKENIVIQQDKIEEHMRMIQEFNRQASENSDKTPEDLANDFMQNFLKDELDDELEEESYEEWSDEDEFLFSSTVERAFKDSFED
jgi:hypothetical protein